MFENIEKEYKKNAKEVKFTKFYWISAIMSTIVFSTIKMNNTIRNYNFIAIILLVIVYLIIDYNKTMKKHKKSNNKLINNLNTYLQILKSGNLNNLIILLKKYNFKTKNDLKLAIDYFNSKRSIKIESSFWGQMISVLVSVASILTVAYDPITQEIDDAKVLIIYGTSIGYILIAIIPIMMIKLIINNIAFSKEKLHTELSDKLSYVYINFNKFKNQLTK